MSAAPHTQRAMDDSKPFDQSHAIALYKDIKYGWVHVSGFQPKDDAQYHSDCVRISEPLTVQFAPLTDAEAIHNALAVLDAAEKAAIDDLNRRLAEIKHQRQSLMVLTHFSDAVVS